MPTTNELALTKNERMVIAPVQTLGRYDETGRYVLGAGFALTPYSEVSQFTPSGTYEIKNSISHKGPPYNEGGPFLVKRVRAIHNITKADYSFPSYSGFYYLLQLKYSGGAILSTSGGAPPAIITPDYLKSFSGNTFWSQTDLNTFGPTAIARANPLKPGASAGQFLAEGLLDGLPNIPLLYSRLKDFRSLGKEYLNVEFGWRPFLSDLQSMYNTYRTLNQRIGQIIRDNGRPIRRRGYLQKSIDTIDSYDFSNALPYPSRSIPGVVTIDSNGESSGGNTGKVVSTRSSQIWYSGQFRYLIPDVTDDRWTNRAKLALFGLNPSPSLLYEVMPWSWLIDWFSNVGDVITNSFNNGIGDLIIDYAYLMRHSVQRTEWSLQFYGLTFSGTQGLSLDNSSVDSIPDAFIPSRRYSSVLELETKERISASPFGFGLKFDELSARQIAILGALGLSRSNL